MSRKKMPAKVAEDLRFENEFLKAKISAEFGARHTGASEDCPPEIENEFLHNVIKYEEALKDAKEIPIYDLIGRPEYMKEQDLSDDQLTAELERVNDLLFEKGIACDTICQVDNRLLYKFLTEELFQQPILDMNLPGMVTHFIYEEFHPNHAYDTFRQCEEILKAFFAKDFHERIEYCFPRHIRNFAELSEFRDCFCKFKKVKFELMEFSEILPGECTRKATVSFDAFTSPGTKPIHYEGEATFELKYENEWWNVLKVRIPGML